MHSVQYSVRFSQVWVFATPRIAACQASLSITNSRSSLKLMSIESVMTLAPLILTTALQGGANFIPSSQMKKLRHRAVENFLQAKQSLGFGPRFEASNQCSCLENPRDKGAWWAAIYGVAQSRTRLKRLSSSSSLAPEFTCKNTSFTPHRKSSFTHYSNT